MKTFWLLYDEGDYEKNRAFAALFEQEGKKRGLRMTLRLLTDLRWGVREGRAFVEARDGAPLPDFAVSRCRDALLLHALEGCGVPVFNSALACEVCNDKQKTHQFLTGLDIPMPATVFVPGARDALWGGERYPLVVKPACSHGGDRVRLCRTPSEARQALADIAPMDALLQRPVSDLGVDKRVYVLFGQIVAAVERRAQGGAFLANFSQGGAVRLAEVTPRERELVGRVTSRLPLALAGVDFLYENGSPVLSELEDVVGCRMLYRVSDIDIVAEYLDAILERLL